METYFDLLPKELIDMIYGMATQMDFWISTFRIGEETLQKTVTLLVSRKINLPLLGVY